MSTYIQSQKIVNNEQFGQFIYSISNKANTSILKYMKYHTC